MPALERPEARADPELFGLYSEIEKPLIEVLASLELTGIRVDVPRLQRLSEEIGRQIDALLQEIFQLAGGEFLPASTQQLAEVLYKRLNLPVLKRGKTGPSTDQEVLEELAQQGAVVVEWGERLAVDDAARIEFEHLGGDRRLIRTIRDLSHR